MASFKKQVTRRDLIHGSGILLGSVAAGGASLSLFDRSVLALDPADGWTARGTAVEDQHGEVESFYFGDDADDDWIGITWTGFNQETTELAIQIQLRGLEDGDEWTGEANANEFEILATGVVTVTGTSGENKFSWTDIFGEPLPVNVDDHNGIHVTEDFSVQDNGPCPRSRELEVRLYVDVVEEDLTEMVDDTSEIFVTSHTGQCPGFAIGVRTGETTDVSPDSATMLGELEQLEGFDEAMVSFEWGESGAGLPNTTAGEVITEPESFDAHTESLTPDTEYEFRAVAEAGGDTDVGESKTFSTPPEGTDPPEIDQFDVIDQSHPVHAEVIVEWAVSSNEDKIDHVTSFLYLDNSLEDSESETIDASEATGEHTLDAHHGVGETFDVVLEVSDTQGYVTSQTQEVTL